MRPFVTAIAPLLLLPLLACGGAASVAPDVSSDGIDVAVDPVGIALWTPGTPQLATYAQTIFDAYDVDRAMQVVEAADGYFRVRGNRGYHAALDAVTETLVAGGVADVQRLPLGPEQPSWSPNSASLILHTDEPITLHNFVDETGFDRATLLVSSASVDGEFEVVDSARITDPALAEGRVVLGTESPSRMFDMYVRGAGAAGIMTHWVEGYNRADLYPETAQFGYLPTYDGQSFGFSISRAAYETLQESFAYQGVPTVSVQIDVDMGVSHADAVQAIIHGSDPNAGAVVFFTHVDEPGANDNGSGVGALTELAIAMHAAVEAGTLPQPERSLIFLWGMEYESSFQWIADNDIDIAAGLVMDMVGEDPEATGAPFLIERMPDPAAIWLRPPDAHTEWGAGYVSEEMLVGHFLNDYLLAAALSVATIDGPWDVRTNPFEGGSDHESFLGAGYPAVLAWHFTDDAYHTTRDRLDRVSGRELRRVSASLGAVAVALASTTSTDRHEMLNTVTAAALLRLEQLREYAVDTLGIGGDPDNERVVIEAWAAWYDEAILSAAADSDSTDLGVSDHVATSQAEVAEAAALLIADLPGMVGDKVTE